MTNEEQIAKLTEMLEIQMKLHETAIDMLKPAIEAEREKVTKERDRMCEHCKWRNDENSTLDETNQSKVLGKG